MKPKNNSIWALGLKLYDVSEGIGV